MPQPKGYEPYTRMWRIRCRGNYEIIKGQFTQLMEATVFAHTEAEANAWRNYFNSIRVLQGKTIEFNEFRWFNKSAFIVSECNGIVSQIWCGISGFSIG